MHNDRLHQLNRIATWLIAGMAVANVAWLIVARRTWDEVVFRGLQYVAMLLIMYLPRLLRRRFRIEVPWLLSVFIVVFCFSSLIMGDGLDLYGRVPIVTRMDIPTDSVQLASRKEVYDFAVSELHESMPLLAEDVAHQPLGEFYGRMTYFVAAFVKMKLYLNHVVYTGTEQPALYDSIVNYADMLSNYYWLEEDLRNNFSLDNDRSWENIFVIPREVGKYVAQYKYEHRTLHYNHAAALGMGGENGTSATLETLDVFGYKTDHQDPRFDLYFYYDTVRVGNQMVYREDGKTPLVYEPDKVAMDVSGTPYEKTAGARLNKYEHDPNGIQDCNVAKNDIVLFRYADVLLMKAEAKLRQGQSAYAEIRQIRDRVGASEIASPTLEDIYHERWRELMWEGWHRNDMIRFGHWTGHTTVFPIPHDILLIHQDWKQNDEY